MKEIDMRKLLTVWIVLAALVGAGVSALAQGGMLAGGGCGKGSCAPASYNGPGDVVSGATAWGSCARVYNAALASTSTPLCDLVDSAAPTVVICTLRGTTSGKVDLAGTYCTGSVTPSAKCAAATGGQCNVSKVYDQAGATGGWLQASAASQPKLLFSALGGLPGMTSIAASNTQMITAGSVSISQPFSASAVGSRTGDFTTSGTLVGATSNSMIIGWSSNANQAQASDPTTAFAQVSATDSVFHALQGVYAVGATNLVISSDGSSGTQTGGSGSISTALRMLRGNLGFTPTATMMEGGIWPSGFSAGQITSMNANQHGAANGYNF